MTTPVGTGHEFWQEPSEPDNPSCRVCGLPKANHRHVVRTVDRLLVNEVVRGLAAEFGVTLDDTTLDDLTHHVANVLDRA